MGPIPKQKPYRNRSFLDLAHLIHVCQVGIPDVCIWYSPDGCEPAHGPKSWLDGGAGQKAGDVFAASCHPCHVELDQGKALTKEARQWYWGRGAARTWHALMQLGYLEVKGRKA